MKLHGMADVRRKVLRAGEVGELAVLFLQHVVAALLHDAAFDRLAAAVRARAVRLALRRLILSDASASWGGSACLVGAGSGTLAGAGCRARATAAAISATRALRHRCERQ
jgi:hypothetical protein